MRRKKINQSSFESPWRLRVDEFDGGTATLLDDSRLGTKFAKETINLMQKQDGVWSTRWGTRNYTESSSAESFWLGTKEIVVDTSTRKIFAVGATTGRCYVYEGSSWNLVDAVNTFTTSGTPSLDFLQINNYLYITNGIDPLTRYDIDTGTLTRYTEIAKPTGLAAVRDTGLSAGNYNHYYKVTALNDVGETEGSAEVSITSNILRDNWDPTADEQINISWDAIGGATRYQIYYSTESGGELLLGESTVNSYVDDNSGTVNPFVQCPESNTTGAPKFSLINMSGNRIWGVGDPDNPYRVYWSGVGQYLGYFSPFYGGGWIDLEKGGRDIPNWAGHFRTGRGDGAATVLTSNPEGLGSVWQIILYDNTIGDVTFLVPAAEKVVEGVGTDSARTVVNANDSIMFMNKRGVHTLGNKPQITNILSTQELSGNIRPSIRSLSLNHIKKFTAYFYDAKIFFSAVESGSENDVIFIFDTERRNWTYKWTIGVRQFMEVTDSSGRTHFLGVPSDSTQLWEFSENYLDDLGVPFHQSMLTGLIPISNDSTEFARVKEAFVRLARPRGIIDFEVIGIQKGKGFSTIATRKIQSNSVVSEFWSGDLGEITLKDEEDSPVLYDSANVTKSKRVNKLLNSIQFKVSANSGNTRFTLLEFMAKGSTVPLNTVSEWRR